jgi:hypothetical protein
MAMVSACYREHTKGAQYGHTEREPEVLLANYANAIRVPRVLVNVVTVAEHDEDPRGRHAGPII